MVRKYSHTQNLWTFSFLLISTYTMCLFQPEDIRDTRIPLRLKIISYFSMYSYLALF